ncbi:MAG: ABC transporter ATP-binding protein [Azoarcus sp.]|jgi:putative ABC transport system ATP-binding protein|nr:ABC transporter ATP-binding protein [Azoarcus sp.]
MSVPSNYTITLDRISKSYQFGGGDVRAVCNISLKVRHGTFAAVRGPSGSGKSTLLNICGLLDSFDTGAYYLNDVNIGLMTDKSRTDIRRREIGFIFQSYNLIPVMNIFDNVSYPLVLLGENKFQINRLTSDVLEKVGLINLAKRLPDQLSGGQRQRAAIARALVKRPTLVIADEPTANLDTKTSGLIVDLMRELGREFMATFLIATHDERMTEHCDEVYSIVDGELA